MIPIFATMNIVSSPRVTSLDQFSRNSKLSRRFCNSEAQSVARTANVLTFDLASRCRRKLLAAQAPATRHERFVTIANARDEWNAINQCVAHVAWIHLRFALPRVRSV